MVRNHVGVVAAALTLWAMFGLWIAAPALGVARGVARTAAGLLAAELVALLASSYGCDLGCSALATAVGSVARTDIPVLAAVFLAAVAVRRRRPAHS